MYSPYFFFSAAATTEIYPLSLHDALPISSAAEAPAGGGEQWPMLRPFVEFVRSLLPEDRKSTRLNSSHVAISYAVFCLKKKKTPPHRGRAPARAVTAQPLQRQRPLSGSER